MFRWCATLSASTKAGDPAAGDPSNVSYHFHLNFPEDYPKRPPAVNSCTPLPHPSYMPHRHPNICCDLLEKMGDFPYSGWTSSYSVLTILVQLQSYLLDDTLLDQATMPQAHADANRYECDQCPHKPGHPYPLPATGDACPLIKVTKPAVQLSQMTQPVPKKPAPSPPSNEAGPAKTQATLQQAKPPSMQAVPAPWCTSSASKTGPKQPQVVQVVEPWHKVGRRGSLVQCAGEPQILAVPSYITAGLEQNNPFEVLSKAKSAASREAVAGVPAGTAMTKAHKKNLARAKARSNAKQPPPASNTEDKEPPQPADSVAAPVATPPVHSTTTEHWHAHRVVLMQRVRLCDVSGAVLEAYILPHLQPENVGVLAASCRYLRSICDDGYVWKELFERFCPASQLTASTVADWKHCYLLEVTSIVGDLRCFHSKVDHTEAVLGMPLQYTVNPKTRRVDYISSTMDILSLQAHKADKVELSLWGESFDELLPLYISDDHFGRALPQIRKVITRLAPEWRTGGRFEPEMVLDVIPKIMTTLIVQIADKGVHASERALDGYCAMHRLLVALVEEFSLHSQVRSRLREFMTKGAARKKEACPGLGSMVALVSVCDAVPWVEFIRPYLEESFDRSVLWTCKAYPALESTQREMEQTPAGPVDMERLELTFDACRVSLRLAMFHAFFVNRVARAQGSTAATAAMADQFYGRPHNKLRASFSAAVRGIMAVDSWPSFFTAVGLQVPSKAHLTGWLLQSIKNSAQKRYHTPGMDFSRIHQSGVSKLLLKGQSYTAGHGLKNVQLEESWGTSGDGSYLDASCLLYEEDGRYIAAVDYSHQRHTGVSHSGDVMDYERSEGRHTMDIDLRRLPAKAHTLYFTITAYTGNLNGYRDPRVKFIDADSGVELCRYDLEATCKTEHKTAIVMCKLVRAGKKGSAQEWAVTAIGHVCNGTVRDYSPIQKTIKENQL